MNIHRWSALYRGYDLSLSHNQLILVLSAVGAASGFFIGEHDFWPSVYQAFVAAVSVFAAGALAKELDPDRPRASLFAATLTLFVAWTAHPVSPVVLFWLLGCVRFVNRTTGLRPMWIDLSALLAITAWLSWSEVPIFGLLFGALLVLDGIVPDGRRTHLFIGGAVLLGSAGWLLLGGSQTIAPALWQVITLLLITIAFIPVVLTYYHVESVGDITGERLSPWRVQAGQAVALSAGLFLASWRGGAGITLLVALWAALLGILAHYLLFNHLRSSVASP